MFIPYLDQICHLLNSIKYLLYKYAIFCNSQWFFQVWGKATTKLIENWKLCFILNLYEIDFRYLAVTVTPKVRVLKTWNFQQIYQQYSFTDNFSLVLNFK